MKQRGHPLRKLRKAIWQKLHSSGKETGKQSSNLTNFFKNRGAEMITMTTL